MSTSKKQKAGKASGVSRALSAKLSLLEVLSAHERLNPPYRDKPYSNGSMDALEEELRGSKQRRSALEAIVRTLDPPLSEYETAVEVVEDPIAHALGREVRSGCRTRYSDKYIALLDEIVSGLLLKQKKKKRKTATSDLRSRDTLSKQFQALGIRSKRKQRSR